MRGTHRTETAPLATAGKITLIAGMLLLTAWAISAPQAGAASVTPEVWCNQAGDAAGGCDVISPGGNPTCADLGRTTLTTGFTRTPANAIPFNWTSTVPVGAVIVKGGPTANVYEYPPGTMSDTVLTTPTNPNNQMPFGLSHILMCAGTTTTTQTTPTTTQTTPTTTTGTTTTGTTTTQTTGTTTPPPTTGTSPPTTSPGPTTITPPDSPTDTVSPTTVAPPGGGPAFTGPGNVIPLAVIALSLLTAGSGLLWAGTRRKRDVEGQD